MEEKWVVIAAVSVLGAFIFYRRIRRLLARQRYSTPRISFRLGLFGLLTLILFPILTLTTGIAPAGGLALGIALGLYGSYLTKFDSGEDNLHFTPNPYIGSVILALFTGRIAYRLMMLGMLDGAAMDGVGVMSAPPTFGRSPLTAVILFILLGYYLSYYISIWIRARALRGSNVQASPHRIH